MTNTTKDKWTPSGLVAGYYAAREGLRGWYVTFIYCDGVQGCRDSVPSWYGREAAIAKACELNAKYSER